MPTRVCDASRFEPSPALVVFAMTPKHVARSAIVRASGPIVVIDPAAGSKPSPETNPRVGRNPYTPQSEAGKRTEPSASLPSAIGTRPAATAAAEPPDEPPGVR